MFRVADYALRVARYAYSNKNLRLLTCNAKHAMTSWILHESEAFICKALKGETIVDYVSPLITQQLEASGSPHCSKGENR